MLVLVALVDEDLPPAGWWIIIAWTWLLGAFFYDLSYRSTKFALFPPLAVAALLPAPLLLIGVFSPSWQVVMALAWVWGTILALGGEALGRFKPAGLSVYSPYLILASVALYLLAAVGGLADRVAFGMAYLIGTAVVYLGLSLYRPRAWLWLASLVGVGLAALSLGIAVGWRWARERARP